MIPTCQELVGFLDDYVENRLSLAKRAAFEVHLAMCRDCRRYLASYRQTIAMAKDAGRADESAGEVPPMPEDLIKAILDARERDESGPS